METLSTAVIRENYLNGNHQHQHSFSSSSASLRHVNYSCGVCGYELNLSSSNRNTSTIDSKYGKSIKRGVISFFYIDESRFTLMDEFQCIPYFFSKSSWGFFRRRTKLLCRKCGNPVGIAYDDEAAAAYPLVSGDEPELSSSSGTSEATTKLRKYDIKIRSLQPSAVDRVGTGQLKVFPICGKRMGGKLVGILQLTQKRRKK
ncbi:unnamed protein product [Linum tenue]|uniref:Uncharacterized protein n=1 Tax=Linum tenue TaxID=586396 RepID=A0AAV0IDE4_9ROSI|nr:unnamed protein product [Linum tenue]